MDLSHFYLPIATKSIRQVFDIDFRLADESDDWKIFIENRKNDIFNKSIFYQWIATESEISHTAYQTEFATK